MRRNERGETRADATEIPTIGRNQCEVYANKLKKLGETDIVVEKHNLQK